MCSQTRYILVIACALLSLASCAPQAPQDFLGFMNQMKQSMMDCTTKGNVELATFRQAMRAGRVLQEYGCIYQCIMVENQWMDAIGNITLPYFTPQSTAACVNQRTAGVIDLCDKAWQASECWVQTREQLFGGFGQGLQR